MYILKSFFRREYMVVVQGQCSVRIGLENLKRKIPKLQPTILSHQNVFSFRRTIDLKVEEHIMGSSRPPN